MDLAARPPDALSRSHHRLISRSYRWPVGSADVRDHARRRQGQRLGRLRRRAAVGSALGFAAFVGLAAQHAVGSSKRTAAVPTSPPVARPAAYFDQQADGFAFDDGSAAPLPPVAQTNVS